MKVIAKTHSNRGHRLVDYLLLVSAKEMRWLLEASCHPVSEKGDELDNARRTVRDSLRNVKIYDKLP